MEAGICPSVPGEGGRGLGEESDGLKGCLCELRSGLQEWPPLTKGKNRLHDCSGFLFPLPHLPPPPSPHPQLSLGSVLCGFGPEHLYSCPGEIPCFLRGSVSQKPPRAVLLNLELDANSWGPWVNADLAQQICCEPVILLPGSTQSTGTTYPGSPEALIPLPKALAPVPHGEATVPAGRQNCTWDLK